MSTALFAVPAILAPLHGLWRRLRPSEAPGPALPSGDRRVCESLLTSIADTAHGSRSERPNLLKTSTPKPLRIVRVVEVGQAPAHVGRMVISGRMADVCAELDRLAALH